MIDLGYLKIVYDLAEPLCIQNIQTDKWPITISRMFNVGFNDPVYTINTCNSCTSTVPIWPEAPVTKIRSRFVIR